jgi:hypothetical protein
MKDHYINKSMIMEASIVEPFNETNEISRFAMRSHGWQVIISMASISYESPIRKVIDLSSKNECEKLISTLGLMQITEK